MTKAKVLTWAELKEFCNNLNEDQLKHEVIWMGEERGGKINGVESLQEDHVNPDDEGAISLSEFEKLRADYEETRGEPIDIDQEPRVMVKGQPIIWTDLD